ncbi:MULTISPECIES: hypothetical protein [Rhodoplanes]|uniref:hypothetical protein n=1 Tax=Rhodoplanes TaxID=29407 RepID=UPI00101DA37B|nr:hypothetical protein [Rhodoplanes serenus]
MPSLRKSLVAVIVAATVAWIIVAQTSDRESQPINSYEKACRDSGVTDGQALKDCIWRQRANVMSGWNNADWKRWQSLTGASDQDVFNTRALVALEMQKQMERKGR